MSQDKFELRPRLTQEEISAKYSQRPGRQRVKTGEQIADEVVLLPTNLSISSDGVREVIAFMASEYRSYQEMERRHSAGFEYNYGDLDFKRRFQTERALLDRLGLGPVLDQIEQAINENMTPNPYEDMDRFGL